jgi:hypothetical protein
MRNWIFIVRIQTFQLQAAQTHLNAIQGLILERLEQLAGLKKCSGMLNLIKCILRQG